ncbi:MAG: three-Cys-motif partner protein TcmP [Methylococcaceae bacterium]
MAENMFHDECNQHVFGGIWTHQKLIVLEKYLWAFTTALKKQHFKLIYVDGFAGTGRCDIKVDGERKSIEGSAKIALRTNPPFDQYFFIELFPKKRKALQELAQEYPEKDIRIVDVDCNIALTKLCKGVDWGKSRAVLFLDPYGLHVEWSTLKVIADTRSIDLWYLFPYAGLYRQAPKDADALDSDKEAAITRILGTEEWRQEFYRQPKQQDIFGKDGEERGASHQDMLDYVTKRLNEIFPAVLSPKVLYQLGDGTNASGAPLFALYFAASNPEPKAQGLAIKIAKDVLKAL